MYVNVANIVSMTKTKFPVFFLIFFVCLFTFLILGCSD